MESMRFKLLKIVPSNYGDIKRWMCKTFDSINEAMQYRDSLYNEFNKDHVEYKIMRILTEEMEN